MLINRVNTVIKSAQVTDSQTWPIPALITEEEQGLTQMEPKKGEVGDAPDQIEAVFPRNLPSSKL